MTAKRKGLLGDRAINFRLSGDAMSEHEAEIPSVGAHKAAESAMVPAPQAARCSENERDWVPFAPYDPDRAPLTIKEWAALDMMRCLFVGFRESESHGCGAAMARGDWYFTRGFSGHFTMALLRYVDAMRRVRRSTFHFSDPRCPCCRPKITDCEARLINILRAQAAGSVSAASTETMLLCDGVVCSELLTHAANVAALLRLANLSDGDCHAAVH